MDDLGIGVIHKLLSPHLIKFHGMCSKCLVDTKCSVCYYTHVTFSQVGELRYFSCG
jgi:hypothetical protein